MKGIFTENMVALLRKRAADRESRRLQESMIRDAVESAVEGTDERIRMVPSYRKQLAPAAENCLLYVNDLVDQIPESIRVSRKTFAEDSRVSSFFVNVHELRAAFSHSSELRDFLEAHQNNGLNECCALVCMLKRERSVFGMELAGDRVRKDVQQTTVSFTDHQINSPAESEQQTREGLKNCMFQGVITSALERMTTLRQRQKELENREHLLRARLHSLQQDIGAGSDESDKRKDIAGLEKQLEEIAEERRNARLDGPADYLEVLRHVLSHPQAFVRLKHQSILLNRLGVMIDEEKSGYRTHPLDLTEVEIGEAERRVVFLARFPRDELLPREDFLQNASRYLSI